MYSLCEKNFFDTLAEVLGDALFDLLGLGGEVLLIVKNVRHAHT